MGSLRFPHSDESGRTEARLLHRIERAEDGMWQEFEYDDAGNPETLNMKPGWDFPGTTGKGLRTGAR